MPDNYDLDINTAYALMRGTTKPVATAFTLAEHVDPIVHLFDIAAGGTGEFVKRPFVKTHISPVICPMRFGIDVVDVVYKCIEHNIPMSCMTASLLGASFEAFVLDDEMHAMTYRTLRGIEVSDDNLGFDAICAAILGDGHFLGSDHTYKAMERDYHYPSLADREQPKTWADAGALTAFDRAKIRTTQILDTHHPTYLTSIQDAEIRAAFKILP